MLLKKKDLYFWYTLLDHCFSFAAIAEVFAFCWNVVFVDAGAIQPDSSSLRFTLKGLPSKALHRLVLY